MRKPETIKWLYLDFDGFFAAVEEQHQPALRGKPVGVIPFKLEERELLYANTCIIAANRYAKKRGVKTGMGLRDARARCPGIQLVPQSPDKYAEAHRKLVLLVQNVIPIDGISSIDEMSCKLEAKDIANPYKLSCDIKQNIRDHVGEYITCSIGMAPNKHLAKIASDMDKPNGLTILEPHKLPGRLLKVPLTDIPGIGKSMYRRLIDNGIYTMEALWNTQPKHLRAIWRNVSGERMWYALHGYPIEVPLTNRSMYGHGRTLPPEWRNWPMAREATQTLMGKAAKRMREDGYLADKLTLYINMYETSWSCAVWIGGINTEGAALNAFTELWNRADGNIPEHYTPLVVHVTFSNLSKSKVMQFNLFDKNGSHNDRWTRATAAIDELRQKYAKNIVTVGLKRPPPGGYAGGKISFTRIPGREDFFE